MSPIDAGLAIPDSVRNYFSLNIVDASAEGGQTRNPACHGT
jgi:hypothetical protein